ncbi:MAG TPA: DUF6600 domain-containing protein [Polyangiaceae bacterium]|jgi:hypothetical protein
MTLSKSGIVALALAAALVPFVSGCAEEEVEAREAAYPQPIGYTTPGTQTQAAAGELPPAPQPATQEQSGQSEEVVVGADGAAQAAPGEEYADTDPSAVTDFRTTLDPYGSWVDDPTYGTVWVPSSTVVGSDFTPYVSAGHWDYDDDYVWVSDYDWGWAPFHYGRWVYAGGYGWEWIPGRAYAGAWVSWRYGYGDWGYVGWAPLGPTWCWRGGVAYGLGFVPSAPYAFVGTGNLFAPSIGSRVVTGSQVGTIGAHTQPWVGANPSVNGRIAANPRVSGPPPQMLHIPPSSIAHTAVMNRGVTQARAFSRSGTAAAMGARPPAGLASGATSAAGSRAVASYGRAPAYGASAPSHFGGRLGSGFSGSVNNYRPYYGGSSSRPSGYSGYSGYSGGAYAGRPYTGGGFSHPGYSGGGFSHPGFAGGGFSGGYHGPTGVAPSGGSHGHSGYSGGAPTGGFHGGGFRGGGGFHGGGGFSGGGFRGGGGGGGHGGHR